MKTKSGKLDRLQIPNPCPADWQQMTGNTTRRFCDSCQKQVYDLSAMTRLQAEALVTAKGGQLCARFTRTADGALQHLAAHTELPQLHQISSRRASPIASAILSAVIATIPAMAVASQTPPSISHSVFAENRQAKPDLQGSTANLSGVVVDESGAAIAGATLLLINENTFATLKSISSEEGKYHFEISGKGIYILKVEAPGFQRYETHGLSLHLANRRQININLRAERQVESLSGVVAVPREPLRELYTESDRVVIATVGKSVKVRKDGDSKLMRVTLEVSSTLKGEHKATVSLYEFLYQDAKSDYIKGEKIVFFLQRTEEEEERDGYFSSGWQRHKKLSDEDLRVYTQHLEELAAILDSDEPALSEITEWLVRCAEDKATQAEGLAEFNEGLQDLRYLKESKERELNKDNEATKEEDDNENEATEPEEEEVSVTVTQPQETRQTADIEIADEEVSEQAKLVRLLTTAQKERLLNLIFNAEKLEDVSSELISFARELKEPRLMPFLISRLQATQNAPTHNTFYYAYVLAEMLGNDKLKKIADEFEAFERIVQTGEDAEEEESEEEESKEVKAKPDETTISQQRSEFVKRFLAAVNKTSKPREEK